MDTWIQPPSSPTSSGVISAQWPDWWISSLRASLVSHTVSLENSDEMLTPGTSGPIPSEPSGKWDPDTSFWRTCQVSFLEQRNDRRMGEPLLGSFPKRGMTASGTLYPLPMSVRHTSGRGGGAGQQGWPTPSTMDHINRKGMRPSRAATNRTTGYLSEAIIQKWPTPRAREGNAGATGSQGSKHNAARGYLDGVVQERWPTPSTRDYKGGYQGGRIRNGKVSRDTLDVAAQATDNKDKSGGQLNPGWVEWLMGLPLGWTALEPLVENAYEYWLDSTVEGTWWDYDPAEIAQPWSDETTPRVVRGMKNRAKRLKALGNGIVPAVVKLFLAGH